MVMLKLVQAAYDLCTVIDDAQIIDAKDDEAVVAYGYVAMIEKDFKQIEDARTQLKEMLDTLQKTVDLRFKRT